jgi:hypothetical protein
LTSSTRILLKNSEEQTARDAPLIHPVAALLLIVIDNLWTLADWVVVTWAATIPLAFLAVGLPSFFIQKFMKGDTTGRALAVSSFLGVLAAVPTPITGTAVGALALGFAGFKYFRKKQEPPE